MEEWKLGRERTARFFQASFFHPSSNAKTCFLRLLNVPLFSLFVSRSLPHLVNEHIRHEPVNIRRTS